MSLTVIVKCFSSIKLQPNTKRKEKTPIFNSLHFTVMSSTLAFIPNTRVFVMFFKKKASNYLKHKKLCFRASTHREQKDDGTSNICK